MISRVGHHSPAHLRQAFAAHHYSWRTYLIVELGSCRNIAGLLRRRSHGLFFLLLYALGASQLLQDGLVEPPIQLLLFFNALQQQALIDFESHGVDAVLDLSSETCEF